MKFIVFSVDSALWSTMYSDFDSNPDVFVIHQENNSVRKVFHRMQFSTKVNGLLNVPGKRAWIKQIVKKSGFAADSEVTVLLFDASYEVYYVDVLEMLRKSFEKIQFVYIWENPITEEVLQKYMTIKPYITQTYTFDKKTAEKNNWQWYQFPYSGAKEAIGEDTERKSDIFFLGYNKGRADQIHELYEKLSQRNIKTDFHIIGINKDDIKEDMKYPEDIHYSNDRMSYNEYLRHVLSTNCLLEIVQSNYQHCTIRTLESLFYKKKLLTTNKSVFNYIDASDKTVRIYNGVLTDADIDFITSPVNDLDFPKRESLSANNLIHQITEKLYAE